MKQRVTMVLCIVLMALQLSNFANAEEARSVSSNDLTTVSTGNLIEGMIDLQPGDFGYETVSNNDMMWEDNTASLEEITTPETVDKTDITGEEEATETTIEETPRAVVEEGNTPTAGMTAEVAATEGKTDTSLAGESAVAAAAKEQLKILAIQVPQNLNFVMDPYNICEQGLVWSQDYAFCNNGETAVKLELGNVQCDVKDDVILAGKGVSDEDVINSTVKMISLKLVMDNGDELAITEEESCYEVILNPGEEIHFSVRGSISNLPDNSWQADDVSFSIVYQASIAEASY